PSPRAGSCGDAWPDWSPAPADGAGAPGRLGSSTEATPWRPGHRGRRRRPRLEEDDRGHHHDRRRHRDLLQGLGRGAPVTLSHGWPLSADAWDGQMLFLAEHGYRAVAHDRRGHGRSAQPSSGNDMDTYADDLAALIEALDLHDVTVVGHSTGGGEVARYVGRHGTDRVAKAVLISAVAPSLVRSEANPDGLPAELFDGFLAAMAADRSQFYLDLARQFYGADRPGATVSQGLLDQLWEWAMQSGLKSSYECVEALAEADFSADLERFDVPTLLVHGEDDQVVPATNAARSARLLPDAEDVYYPAAPHGLTATHQDRLNADLLAFLQG